MTAPTVLASPSQRLVRMACTSPGFTPGALLATFHNSLYHLSENPSGGKRTVGPLLKEPNTITTSGPSRKIKKSTMYAISSAFRFMRAASLLRARVDRTAVGRERGQQGPRTAPLLAASQAW